MLDTSEYVRALDAKLLEEASELRQAGPEQRLEEAADVYEVLASIASTLGVTMSDVCGEGYREARDSRWF